MKNILLAMLFSAFVITASADTIYVKPSGAHDAEEISAALKEAREWRRLARMGHAEYQQKIQNGVVIKLQKGTYFLSKPIFIRPEDCSEVRVLDANELPINDYSTTILGEDGAVISGGVEVTGWTQYKGNIFVAKTPKVNGRRVETRQLWIGDKKGTRATMLPDGKMERMIAFNTERKTITIPTPKFNLSNAENLEMLACQRWAIAILRIKEMKDLGNGQTEVSFHNPESDLEFSHPWPQPVIEGENRSAYTLTNAMEFLDTPGEWYQDDQHIYIYTADGRAPQNVFIPHLTTLVNIEGTEQSPVHDIIFENISFQHAAWLRPSIEGHVTLQGGFRLLDAYKLPVAGLPHKAALENQAWIARPETAFRAVHANELSFNGCTFEHLGATALDLEQNISFSRVRGCTFHDIGGNAILLGDFPDKGFETHIPYAELKIDNPKAFLCHDILIKDNHIYDATNEDWGCVGIGAGYVSATTIDNNHVHDLNYSGICVGWGWTKNLTMMSGNIICNNKVHDFAKQLYDAGGIYTLSNQPGSEIRLNEIYNIGCAPYATNDRAFYIYFDEATDGYTVEKNKCPEPHFGYNQPGPDMVVQDNGPQIDLEKERKQKK